MFPTDCRGVPIDTKVESEITIGAFDVNAPVVELNSLIPHVEEVVFNQNEPF